MVSPTEKESSYPYVIVPPDMPLLEVTKRMRLAGVNANCYAIIQNEGEIQGYFYAQTLLKAVADGLCLEKTLVSEVMISISQTNTVGFPSSNFPQELARTMQQTLHKQYATQKREALVTTIAARLRESYNPSVRIEAMQVELENCLRAVTQLQEQAVLYQCIVEMAGEGIWVIDSNAITSFVNPRMADILGYHIQEMLGQSLLTFMDEEVQAICSQMLEYHRQGFQERHEFRLKSKTGTDIWTLVAATPILGAGGQYQGALAMVTDISDRKRTEVLLEEHSQILELQIQQRTQSFLQAQKELKVQEQFLRSIYEGSDAPIWVIDVLADGTFCNGGLNPKAEYFTGLKAEDVAGKTPVEIFGPVQGADICNLFSHCVAIDTPIIYEECRDFHDKIYWLSTTLTPLKDKEDRIYRLVGHSLDITARKEAEISQQAHLAELAKWQNRYEMAGEASGQILYEYDVQSDHPLWGANTEKIVGYPAAMMPGSIDAWMALIHPEDIEEFHAQRELLLRHKTPLRIEYRFRHRNGTYIWLEDKNRFLPNPEGESHRIVGFISNISDKKEAQLQLKQINTQLSLKNEELAYVMQMKDEFLASMSHELRTPLNAILGNSEILLEEILGSISERQRKAVSSIERSGQHLLSLINDVLDLAKIGSGQLDLQLAPIPIRALCSSCIEFVQPLAEKKQIQLNAHLSISDLTMLQGDERRLRQVLINLLSNAIKFTPNGGNVTLKVQPNVQFKIIQFSVKDTGVGIAPENLQKLFQSFVQVDSSLNRRHEGTGLGLAIVKKLVELHNGTVSVESTIDQGSCFTVSFPWS
jgi:PAS domain S-box-containing protein